MKTGAAFLQGEATSFFSSFWSGLPWEKASFHRQVRVAEASVVRSGMLCEGGWDGSCWALAADKPRNAPVTFRAPMCWRPCVPG